MKKDADLSQVQLLKVDGGASNNNLLMQMQADALQVNLTPHVNNSVTHCLTACQDVMQVANLKALICAAALTLPCLLFVTSDDQHFCMAKHD